MTSKEALEKLFNDLKQFEGHFVGRVCNDTKEEYYLIKKDLEVLEILKTEIFNEEHFFDLDVGWYDDSFDLNEKEAKIIKEWLEHD